MAGPNCLSRHNHDAIKLRRVVTDRFVCGHGVIGRGDGVTHGKPVGFAQICIGLELIKRPRQRAPNECDGGAGMRHVLQDWPQRKNSDVVEPKVGHHTEYSELALPCLTLVRRRCLIVLARGVKERIVFV